MTNQPFPNLNSQVMTPDGIVTPVWRAFFQTIWLRGGGATQTAFAALTGDSTKQFQAATASGPFQVVNLAQAQAMVAAQSGPYVDLTSSQTITGAKTFVDTNFILQDNIDPTRIAKFELANLVGAQTYALPNASGNVALDTVFGSANNGLVPASGGGTINFLRADGTWIAAGGGTGDMILASAQTNTGIKTFLDTTLGFRNAANTFTALFTNAITAARTYTLKDASGTLAFTSDITGINSGTNTGDQTITLTGNVTGTGTGSFATTISASAVTLAMQANIATGSIMGRTTAAAGVQEVLTPAQAKTVLAIANTDVSGLGALATLSTISLTTLATGVLQAAQEPAHTGDVTNTAGSLAMTLATVNANVGSFGLAASVAQFTTNAKGLITAAANVAISITSAAISDLTTAIMTLAGTQTVTGAKTFSSTVAVSDTFLAVRNTTDATKQIKLDASIITTATTRTLTVPDASGTLALLNGGVSQTFTGAVTFGTTATFQGASITVGNNSVSSTLSLASGVTASGSTKAVNIGTLGAAGSTTTITIGPVAGAGTGTVAISTGVTAFSMGGASLIYKLGASTAKSALATLTAAEVLAGIIEYSGLVASLTMPTGATLDAGIPTVMGTDQAFKFSVIDTGTGAVTMVANTGITIVGAAMVAVGASGRFMCRRTAAATYILYRIA